MKQIKQRLCLVLAVLLMCLSIPVSVMAAEMELQTKFTSVKEIDGKVIATYETGEGPAPDRILYAVSKNGQFVWDGMIDLQDTTDEPEQECIMDIPTDSFQRSVYDIVIWAEQETEDGETVSSNVFAFRSVMGNMERTVNVPKLKQPKTMVVRMPFAYIAEDAAMDAPICYLKCGDTVQVYTDIEDNAVLYVAKGNVGGYMYSRSLASKVFEPAGKGNEDIVKVALEQVGNQGGEKFWRWYGFDSRIAWCACFVSWCADQCGYIEDGIIPKFAACTSQGMPWFIERGQWEDRNIEPLPGYIIFFDWDNTNNADHVGIVEKCEDGIVYTIEGNSGDVCCRRSYPVGSTEIRGYGIPNYSQE